MIYFIIMTHFYNIVRNESPVVLSISVIDGFLSSKFQDRWEETL